MQKYIHLFQQKMVVENEKTALLTNSTYTTAIPISKKENTKSYFTPLSDNNVDEIIASYFIHTMADILTLRLLSTPLSKIAEQCTPFSLSIIKTIFLGGETELIVRKGFKTAKIPVFDEKMREKFESFKKIEVATLDALKENIAFKMHFFDYFPSGINKTVAVLFWIATVTLLVYFFISNPGIFKSPDDIFFCDVLTPSYASSNIPQDAVDKAAAWITRNHPRLNTTSEIIAFCNMAQEKYCPNFFYTNKKAVFDSTLGANVICEKGVGFLMASNLFFLLSLLIVAIRFGYVLKKWPTLSEKKMSFEL